MKYYRITNLTNKLNKRDVWSNDVIEIPFVYKMEKKTKKIFPGETLYIELEALPLSMVKLRKNGYVAVAEISVDEFLFEQKKIKSIESQKNTEKKTIKQTTKKRKTTGNKKTTTKKSTNTKKNENSLSKENDNSKVDSSMENIELDNSEE